MGQKLSTDEVDDTFCNAIQATSTHQQPCKIGIWPYCMDSTVFSIKPHNWLLYVLPPCHHEGTFPATYCMISLMSKCRRMKTRWGSEEAKMGAPFCTYYLCQINMSVMFVTSFSTSHSPVASHSTFLVPLTFIKSTLFYNLELTQIKCSN